MSRQIEAAAETDPQASKLRDGVALGAAGVVGGVEGAIAANYILPPNIEIAPGVKAKISLELDSGTTITSDALEVNAPNLEIDTPIPGVDGVRADVTEMNPSVDEAPTVYDALASDIKTNIAQPASHNVTHHLAKGAGAGAITAAALTVVGMKLSRKYKLSLEKRRNNQEDRKESDEIKQRPEKGNRFRSKKLIAALALVGALGGQVAMFSKGTAEDREAIPLSPFVVAREPALEGATVSGITGQGINLLINTAVERANKIDEFWASATEKFNSNFSQYQKLALPFDTDSKLKPIIHISDFHCDSAEIPYIKNAFARLKIPTIVNTGDTSTNSGSMPYEENCFANLIDAVEQAGEENEQKITMINISGNHDPKDAEEYESDFAKVVTLTSEDSTYEKDGFTFVGEQDPVAIKGFDSVPSDITQQNEMIAAAGSDLSDKACAAEKDTNNPVVVLAHRIQQAYESLRNGCGQMELSGHNHNESEIHRMISDDGEIIYQHTAGTLSGADIGFTLYDMPSKAHPASFTVMYLNKFTGKPKGVISAVLDSYGNLSFIQRQLPIGSELAASSEPINDFLDQYTKLYDNKSPSDG